MKFVPSLRACLPLNGAPVIAPDASGSAVSGAAELFGPDSVVGVTIGNFDGMHIGHRALFDSLKAEVDAIASAEGKTPCRVLITFAPHPRQVFSKRPYQTLTTLRQKEELTREFGFDVMIVQRFIPSFFQISPLEFIEKYLVNTLHARVVVVGADWSFGKGRAGTVETLSQEGARLGFSTHVVTDVAEESLRVSSSSIRRALLDGDLQLAEKLLGRPFEILGRVSHGDKRGRTLGFPTANVHPGNQVLPPDGVYAGFAEIDGTTYQAALSLGVRPVFEEDGKQILEVHLLDDAGPDAGGKPAEVEPLYGKLMRVTFVKFLRSEFKFDSVQALIKAMAEDVTQTRSLLSAKLRSR